MGAGHRNLQTGKVCIKWSPFLQTQLASLVLHSSSKQACFPGRQGSPESSRGCSHVGNDGGAPNPTQPGSAGTRQLHAAGWAELEEGACEWSIDILMASPCLSAGLGWKLPPSSCQGAVLPSPAARLPLANLTRPSTAAREGQVQLFSARGGRRSAFPRRAIFVPQKPPRLLLVSFPWVQHREGASEQESREAGKAPALLLNHPVGKASTPGSRPAPRRQGPFSWGKKGSFVVSQFSLCIGTPSPHIPLPCKQPW